MDVFLTETLFLTTVNYSQVLKNSNKAKTLFKIHKYPYWFGI